jgi:hypothetical protein
MVLPALVRGFWFLMAIMYPPSCSFLEGTTGAQLPYMIKGLLLEGTRDTRFEVPVGKARPVMIYEY